ncbi:hypothetical protein, partial [Streptomyces djakartensis]|uniref:hypothetical protein n=1 Tax=Streptomyces djakartensis TaxID=68193 RepID=UPI0034E03E3E
IRLVMYREWKKVRQQEQHSLQTRLDIEGKEDVINRGAIGITNLRSTANNHSIWKTAINQAESA